MAVDVAAEEAVDAEEVVVEEEEDPLHQWVLHKELKVQIYNH